MTKRILDILDSPQDLKLLSDEELTFLAAEIREEIITVTAKTGGHVASSLGTVEIILAVHSLLNGPDDKFLFDVGHQSYAHKLITGRLGQFATLRQHDGLSGFPKPAESPFDVYPSGHASDSLSVALGLAKARDLSGANTKVVALIGDAAISGGMAFEALNHIGQAQTPLVIILNDNEMSISRNVGALVKHLGFMRATKEYRQTRDHVQDVLEQQGRLGMSLVDWGRNIKESLKQFVLPRTMIFEQLGIMCTAPVDGHDITALRDTLKNVLQADGPVLMHVVTKKGLGYEPARKAPETFHGVGAYDIATGEVKKKSGNPAYTKVFGQAL
ncbi:MAG: 1-deoxy-D-xylulose-5-phosphate synthase N-terminal domain-containing protein, partial [Raoultibacter sp.]